MCLQRACKSGCKTTQIAFVWLFSTVCFEMRLQMVCPRRCIVTLVAFVKLVYTVCCQMFPQSTCLRGCIVTLVAFVRFFSSVYFQMFPQFTCLKGCIGFIIKFIRGGGIIPIYKNLCCEFCIFWRALATWNWHRKGLLRHIKNEFFSLFTMK